jgi:hypothetical protein
MMIVQFTTTTGYVFDIIIFKDLKNHLIFAVVSTLYCAGAAMAAEHGKSI